MKQIMRSLFLFRKIVKNYVIHPQENIINKVIPIDISEAFAISGIPDAYNTGQAG